MRSGSGFRMLLGMLPLLLAGCYVSETRVLDESNSIAVAGVTEGLYCHIELGADPPRIAPNAAISLALGDNRCRDLSYDAATGLYLDARSTSIELRVGNMDQPLNLLQVQTGPTAPARFAPLAVVDGLFVQYDPSGRWPSGLVEASGLALNAESILVATDPGYVQHVLYKAFDLAIEKFRRDLVYVEDADGPRIELADPAEALSYIVYVHEHWGGDIARMHMAMRAMAEKLGLEMRVATP